MRMERRPGERFSFSRGIFFFLLACLYGAAVAPAGEVLAASPPGSVPPVVYVADFKLDTAAGDRTDHRPFQVRKKIRDTLDEVTDSASPEQKAQKIVEALSHAIIEELGVKKIPARRLAGSPSSIAWGWVLEGEFMEYDSGDRLKRAVIGFGSGSASMEVNFLVRAVADGKARMLLDTRMEGKKNRMPGAVITKNPYVAGAKFVVTKNAPDRDVKKLGAQIADRVYEIMKEKGLVRP